MADINDLDLGKAIDELSAHCGSDKEDEPVGTKATGYAGPELGPFSCGGCVHFDDGTCNHPDVIKDEEIEKKDGLAIVQAAGCCNYFHPSKKDD